MHVTGGNIKFKVERVQKYEKDVDAEIDWDASVPGSLLAVSIPFRIVPSIKIIPKLSNEAMHEAVIEGRAQFRFEIANATVGDRVVPQLRLSVDPDAAFVQEFDCRYHPRYCGIYNSARAFMPAFINLEDDIWD